MQRVIAYVDGYNLYYGLRAKQWKRFYWLNVQKLMGHFLRAHQRLVETKYFTTVVEEPADKRQRQRAFLDALQTLSDFKIFYGHFLSDAVTCSQCGHVHHTHHEKMTDVNIAVELMTDAFQDRFDVALLVSADSDLVAPLKAIRQLFPKKQVAIIFPPARYSNALSKVASQPMHISRKILAKSIFPPEIPIAGGHLIRCPNQWR